MYQQINGSIFRMLGGSAGIFDVYTSLVTRHQSYVHVSRKQERKKKSQVKYNAYLHYLVP